MGSHSSFRDGFQVALGEDLMFNTVICTNFQILEHPSLWINTIDWKKLLTLQKVSLVFQWKAEIDRYKVNMCDFEVNGYSILLLTKHNSSFSSYGLDSRQLTRLLHPCREAYSMCWDGEMLISIQDDRTRYIVTGKLEYQVKLSCDGVLIASAVELQSLTSTM